MDDDVEKSVIDEIDALDVVEAEELKEGAAFHAFRFMTNP